MSNLYSRIMQKCEEFGISGYRLCKDCGISPSVITDLGKGRKKTISADYANKISKRLGVEVDWLINGEGEENKKSPAVETAELDEDALTIIELLGKLTPSNRDRAIAYLQGLVAGQS